MRARVLGVAALAAALLALPTAAVAKGATAARIDGPGGRPPIVVHGEGEPGSGTGLGTLAEQSGLFAAMFQMNGQSLQATRPAGDLGPRWTITYTIPGGDGGDALVRQDLYPYASGGPVTFTPPGQQVFGGQPVQSGWYRAQVTLRDALVSLGLPKAAPGGRPARVQSPPAAQPARPAPGTPAAQAATAARTAATRSGANPWPVAGAAGAALLLAAGATLGLRRRSRRRAPTL